MHIQVTRSQGVEVGYIELSGHQVSHSGELNPHVVIDFDNSNCVLGVELLSLRRLPTVDEIAAQFHVKTEDRQILDVTLKHLMRMSVTSGSLTGESRVRAQAVTGRELEAC
ncbi:DUF2283 domain-containing protein [Corynebacterium sp. CCUG 61414]|uniref:DUF2283 domain-containing protein n=1 Tax=Corynebacterium sp. CCUG 61414 TaxID=2823896 RepID=UPI00210ABF2A|nr:DUF2283 domain-containing protein [Corynebacterium sp. CCUG 61414]MCQ4610376.1 DUF2283 domain-containing protein [Corynebacterium sp. CCUG 61414]